MPGFAWSCGQRQKKERARVESEFDDPTQAEGDIANPFYSADSEGEIPPRSRSSSPDGTFETEGAAAVEPRQPSSRKERKAAKKLQRQRLAGVNSAPDVEFQQGALKQGYLTKQGHVRKNWKRRWFVLTRRQITYHVAPGAPAKGIIPLDNVTISLDTSANGREHCFGLFAAGYSSSGHSERKAYFICAETAEEFGAWVKAIRHTASTPSSRSQHAAAIDALSVCELVGRCRALGVTDKALSAAMGRDDLVRLVDSALAKQTPRALSAGGKPGSQLLPDGEDSGSDLMQKMFRSTDSVGDVEMDAENLEAIDPELHAIWVKLAEEDLKSARSGGILLALEEHGLQPDDPRVLLDVAMLQRQSTVSISEFRRLVTGNVLVDRALHGRLAISDFPSFRDEIEAMKIATEPVDTGKVATYIPQLARVDPNQYGVAVCTIDGQQSFCGDYETPFSIQSTMKPIAYAMALEEHGERAVHQRVGREPSGLNFNHRILNQDDLPHNPMINAGAIMVSSLVRADLPVSDRFDAAMDVFTRLAGGRRPGFANSVYLSEKATADRNFSLLYMMKEVSGFTEGTNVEEALDFYLMLCSIELDCRTMATVAGTLANGGVNPLTGDRIFNARAVRDTLSLMASCGMYDFSGEFAFRMGFPCKSGVSGSLCIVIPGVTGICAWSPALDELGNSTRGNAFCQALVQRFRFHMFDIHSTLATASSDKIDLREKGRQNRDASANSLYIHWAAANGQLEWLKQLTSRGLDIDSSDHDGCTPMHLAAANGHATCLEFLLKQNADDTLLNRNGQTAVQMALPGPCAKALKAYRRRVVDKVADPLPSDSGTSSDGSDGDLEPEDRPPPQEQQQQPSKTSRPDRMALRYAFRHLAPSTEKTAKATKSDLLSVVKTAGLSDCSRLKEVLTRLPDTFTTGEFEKKADDSVLLQALTGRLVIPAFTEFESELHSICERMERTVRSGNASAVYPASDIDSFAMAACTVSGQRCSHGASEEPVLIAELSAVLNYCLVNDLLGEDAAHRYVGHEPAPVGGEDGLRDDGRPHNPCVLMGNLVTASLIEPTADVSARLSLIRSTYDSAADGSRIGCNDDLVAQFMSGRSTESARTHSMAYRLLELGAFPEGASQNVVAETLELYYKMMSTTMSTNALSVVAATLANGGINPCTGERVFSEQAVQNTLSVMHCCGHRSRSGEHAFAVGIPGMTGSSGTTLVCVPGVVGFCVHSPRLDKAGNSVRAVAFARALSATFKFHIYEDHISTHQVYRLLLGDEDGADVEGNELLVDPTDSPTTAAQIATSELFAAAASGNLPFIRRANTNGVVDLLEASDYNGRTALHVAAAEGQALVVRFILAEGRRRALRDGAGAGAAVTKKDRWGKTPRDQAAASNHTTIAELL